MLRQSKPKTTLKSIKSANTKSTTKPTLLKRSSVSQFSTFKKVGQVATPKTPPPTTANPTQNKNQPNQSTTTKSQPQPTQQQSTNATQQAKQPTTSDATTTTAQAKSEPKSTTTQSKPQVTTEASSTTSTPPPQAQTTKPPTPEPSTTTTTTTSQSPTTPKQPISTTTTTTTTTSTTPPPSSSTTTQSPPSQQPHAHIATESEQLHHPSLSLESTTNPFQQPKTAILMLNMGGPSDPIETESFLTNLFSDPMIINLGKFQWLGAKGAQRRTQKVQKQYERIGGSPIAAWTHKQGKSLSNVLDIVSPSTAPHKHYVGFRYAQPLLTDALQQIKADGVKRVIAFSQYPMYSCTTTGSSLNDLWTQAKELGLEGLDFTVIDRWHDNDYFHEAVAENIKAEITKIPSEELQHTAILFSAHSVPLKTMNKGDQYPAEISHTVEQTMVKLHKLLRIEDEQQQFPQDLSEIPHIHRHTPHIPHQLCWQSKVGFLPWLKPSTSTAIEKLKDQGFKQAIIVPIAFTSDHIETLHEIDIEYQELAHKNGVKLIRAESLNNSMFLTKAQANIVKNHIDRNEIVSSHQYRIKCHECVQPDLCRTVIGYNDKDLFINQRIPKV